RREPLEVSVMSPQIFSSLVSVQVPPTKRHWQTEIVGEVTQNSALFHARLSKTGKIRWRNVEGREGLAAIALSTESSMIQAVRTEWASVNADHDYVVKFPVKGLEPGTRYYYKLLSGEDEDTIEAGPLGTFETLASPDSKQPTQFAVVSCMNRFAYQIFPGSEKEGFPALETIRNQSPQFIVFTGDNVYYDTPYSNRATTLKAMRGKWHRQFATDRFEQLFQSTPTYWEKDDHDYRFNDADPFDLIEPSHELGVSVFREQVPVVDPSDPNAVTYRTHRINHDLQVWLLEGRDYRSPNTEIPGPKKTMWGETQKAWLKQTLNDSTATFKVIISPTPLVGPDETRVATQGGVFAPLFGGDAPGQDDKIKRDNHTNVLGFRQERDEFFKWLKEQGFKQGDVFIVCGDRHWQYHSIHPFGFDELSCGALLDANSRGGLKPGEANSTDPDATIQQLYLQTKRSGGFLRVSVQPEEGDRRATITFDFFNRKGESQYQVSRPANDTRPNGGYSTMRVG
ncbi:MAG: alkaline phosphatase D family protein, partial [Leptolyngbyaceae bacterium]|nr:alkaline phosphatase D family protein [Leptolyngbyaceae bacterium]